MIMDKKRKITAKVSKKALIAMLLIGCLFLPVIGGIGLVRFAGARTASNDGKIAFSSNRDGDFEIYVMDADGSNQTRLTNNSVDDLNPAWSPDGKKIAFASLRGGMPDIYVMDTDGSNVKWLTTGGGIMPEWSPDGKRIVFMGRGDFLDVMDADGGNLKKLTEMAVVAGMIESSPSWSPDGTKIIFHRGVVAPPQKLLGIYVIDADGKNEKLLNSWGMGAAWSPDGKRIAFYDQNYCIYTMDADGLNVKKLTEPGHPSGWNPVWSPDGKRIAFVSDHDGNNEIYVMDADGSNVQRLTNTPANEFDFDWTAFSYVVEPADKLMTTWGKIKQKIFGK